MLHELIGDMVGEDDDQSSVFQNQKSKYEFGDIFLHKQTLKINYKPKCNLSNLSFDKNEVMW